MSIYQKIEELKKEYSSEADIAVIDGWQRELMELAPQIELAKVKPISDLLNRYMGKIRANKERLTTETTIDDRERIQMLAEIKVYNELLNYFLSAKNYAKYIVKNIEEAK